MRTLFSIGTIEQQTEQWGLWARGGLGAMACQVREGLTPNITDDEGIMFDGVVQTLREFDARAFNVIKRHYVCSASLSEIAIELGCGRTLVKSIHKNALFYLAGVMASNYRRGAFCKLSNMTYEVN